ncbi:MAG TPA: DUF362 domain-containing protein [Bryobacteraceae bacterium]|nr:DUF362 domain-containing protein [Bryobacteraceae bacterium]
MSVHQISRRQLLTGTAAAAMAAGAAKTAPASTVAIARCRSYADNLEATLARMFDQIGGLGPLVKNKTVAFKLNLTGNPGRYPVDPALPYRTNPATVLAAAHLMARAGARRIRIIESFFPAGQDMSLWARYQLDIPAINNVGCKVEWENVQNRGQGKQYVRMRVPWGGYVFPAYELNHSFADCDTFVSMSKLKHHWVAGVTMALKNSFGNTPCSLYGGDAGPSGNEDPKRERGAVCHDGASTPPAGVPQELKPDSPRDQGYRVPRIVVDLVGARPIDLSIVDGVESVRGGEGVWNPGISLIKPGLLLAGRNPVCVDAVSTAVMGHDPRADRGTDPFLRGDNCMKLAEAVGIGTADLARIEVAGLSIKAALFKYGPGAIGKRV